MIRGVDGLGAGGRRKTRQGRLLLRRYDQQASVRRGADRADEWRGRGLGEVLEQRYGRALPTSAFGTASVTLPLASVRPFVSSSSQALLALLSMQTSALRIAPSSTLGATSVVVGAAAGVVG